MLYSKWTKSGLKAHLEEKYTYKTEMEKECIGGGGGRM